MEKIFTTNIGDLIDLQRASYYNFLLKGLESELIAFKNKSYSLNNRYLGRNFFYKLYFITKNIKFSFPEENFLNIKDKDRTYSVQAYIPLLYSCKKLSGFLQKTISKKNKEIKSIYFSGDIFLSEIPLMTSEGTFFITGCERIVVSQIVRSPGVYFRREFNNLKKNTLCTATIISDKGLWTKFILLSEKKKNLKISISSTNLAETINNNSTIFNTDENEISIMSFLKYFNITKSELSSFLIGSQKKFLQYFTKELNLDTKILSDNLYSILDNIFYNVRVGSFSIGEIGRKNINQKFKYSIPNFIHYICGSDLLFIFKNLIDLKYFGTPSDDIDHIKNKQIRPVGIIMQNQFRINYLNTIDELSLSLPDKLYTKEYDLSIKKSLDSLIYLSTKKIYDNFLNFFKLSEIAQYMDQINSLSEISHKRRISVFGPNGLQRDNVTMAIRDIHPSQYAKICPIETPEGETAGLISSLSIFARYNKLGYLETPYYQVIKGKIDKNQPAIYLNPQIEVSKKIAFCDTGLDAKNSKLLKQNFKIKNDNFFSIINKEEVEYLTLSPSQLLSLATNIVPFIEHDDANRGLMGANMQRQAVPLLYNEKALVCTGFENNVILDSNMILTSYTEGQIIKSSSKYIYVKDMQSQILKYKLKKYNRSNQDTIINQQSCVWDGEHIYSNQIIADGGGSLDGEFAIGKNLTIAYMPWDGYNFEDAIIINEKLIINDSLTSINIQEYETYLENFFIEDSNYSDEDKKEKFLEYLSTLENISTDFIIEILPICLKKFNDLNSKKSFLKSLINILDKKKLYNLDKIKSILETIIIDNLFLNKKNSASSDIILKNKLDQLASIDNENERIYITKFHLADYENKNLDYDGIIKNGSYVYPNDVLVARALINKKLNSGTFELLNALNKKTKKEQFVDKSFRVADNTEGRILDRRFIFEKNILDLSQIGDKNSLQEFPIAISREKLKFYIVSIRKIEIGDKLAGRHGNKGVISKIVCSQDMPLLPDGTAVDIIFNPLGVPSRMNVGQIFESLLGLSGIYLGKRFKIAPFDELFGQESSRILINQKLKEARIKSNNNWLYSKYFPGKILLRDGRTGEFFDNPIFVGKSYIIKLIHLVHDKQHARSVGPYSSILEQPTAGKRFDGGQRFGEMETWALEGFGCAMTLTELFTIKADDINGRIDFYDSLISDKKNKKPKSFVGETFLTLIRELNAIGLNFMPKKISASSLTNIQILDQNIFNNIEQRLTLIALMKKLKKKSYIEKIIKKNK